MSNRRSLILLIVLVIIVSYLYFDSAVKNRDAPMPLNLNNKSTNVSANEKYKVLNKRSLLSLSVVENEDLKQMPNDDPSSKTMKQNQNLKTSNYISPISALNSSKIRLKREAQSTSDALNWKFNVNVTKLGDKIKSSINGEDITKATKSKIEDEKRSLSMAVYVEGNGPNDSYGELQQAWNSVGDFLKQLFGKSPEELKDEYKVVLDTNGFLNQLAQISNEKNSTIEVKEKQQSQLSKSKKGKFLSILDFNFGSSSNKENPPLEIGSGEVLENKDSQTELNNFHITSLKGPSDSEVNAELSPPALSNGSPNSTETDFFEIVTNSSNVSPSTITNMKSDLSSKHFVDHSAPSSGFTKKCQNCGTDLNFNLSEFGVSSEDIKTFDKVPSVEDIPVVFTEKSAKILRAYCLNLFKHLKSPRFLEEFPESSGSGSIENSKLTLNQSESTTTVAKALDSQSGLLQNLWNRIRSGFRNERRIDESSENFAEEMAISELTGEEISDRMFISGLLNGLGSGRSNDANVDIDEIVKISSDLQNGLLMEDCRNLFMNNKDVFTTQKLVDFIYNENTNREEFTSPRPFEFDDNETFPPDSIRKIPEFSLQTTSNPSRNTITSFKVEPTTKFQGIKAKVATETAMDAYQTTNPEKLMNPLIGEDSNLHSQGRITPTTSTLDEVLETDSLGGILRSGDPLDLNKEIKTLNLISTSTLDSLVEETEQADILIQDGKIFNYLNTEDVLELGSSDDGRIFGNFFSSGEKELKNTDFLTVSTISPLVEQVRYISNFEYMVNRATEISEVSTQDINVNIKTFDDRSFFVWGLGSGERNLDNVKPATNDENLEDVVDYVSEILKSDFTTLKSNIVKEEIRKPDNNLVTVELQDLNTSDSQRTFDDFLGFGSGDSSLQETEINRLGFFDIFGSGDSRVLPEDLDLNKTIFNVGLNCTNCSKGFAFGCENCKDDEMALNSSYINPTNETNVISPLVPKASLSELCEDCENSRYNNTATIVQVYNSTEDNRPTISRLDTVGVWISKSNPVSLNTTNDLKSLKGSNGTKDPKDIGLLFNDSKANKFDNSQIPQDHKFSSQSPISQLPRRGARAHDLLPTDWPDLVTTEESKEKSQNSESSISRRSLTGETSQPDTVSTLNFIQTSYNEMNDSASTQISSLVSGESKTKIFSATLKDNLEDLEVSVSPEILQKNPTESLTTVLQDIGQSIGSIPVTTEKVLKSGENINPKVKNPPKKICRSASECNDSLNERCLSNDDISTCDCGRAFKRHPETGKCEATITLKTSLRLPGEKFHDDLKDTNSELFKEKRIQSIETMWVLLEHNPDIFLTVAEVDVAGFDEGSLLINWDLKLVTGGNETVSELIDQIDKDLEEVMKNEDLLRRLPLDIHNASISTFAANPCEKIDMNYCHKYAECILDEADGFRCLCKDGYLDNSNDKLYPGEVCIAYCRPYDCGDHGECKLKENGDKHCLCSGWFFGEKCEISGIVVIASFAAVNILIIFMVLIMVCVCKKRRRRRSNFYNRNVIQFQPGQVQPTSVRTQRVADAIAMDEVGPSKISKYVTISTPLFEQAPAIQITSPSFSGSSIDYDSTFDRSRFSEENSRNSRNEDMAKV